MMIRNLAFTGMMTYNDSKIMFFIFVFLSLNFDL